MFRVEITKKMEGENWNFDEALKVFSNELTARKKCCFVKSTCEDKKRVPRDNDVRSGSSLVTHEVKEFKLCSAGRNTNRGNAKVLPKFLLVRKYCMTNNVVTIVSVTIMPLKTALRSTAVSSASRDTARRYVQHRNTTASRSSLRSQSP